MSKGIAATVQKSNMDASSEQRSAVAHRQCACGQHTVAGGECEACRKKRVKLQRWDEDQVGPSLATAVAPTDAAGLSNRFDMNFTHVQLQAPRLLIQRMPAGDEAASAAEPDEQNVETTLTVASTPASAEAIPSPEPAGPESSPVEATTKPVAPETKAVPGLLVDDEVTDLGEGQMRKHEFLAELRTAVCAVADAELAAAGRNTEGCPYLEYWFDYYEQRDAAHVERALRRYAPQARNAANARAYIPLVAERVRQGVARWVSTGEVSGVPNGVPITLPGEPSAGSGQSNGTTQFKAHDGGARPDDPVMIRDQLGYGRSLDSSVRSRMESAFGTSFSHVRMHNDSKAASLSHNQNARAFTVGKHVAFGAGEYQPGTILGDALIAHELAHVVQQSGTGSTVASMGVTDRAYDVLEKDADLSAIGAVTSLWSEATGMVTDIALEVRPRLNSGLSLQRCGATHRTTTPATSPTTTPPSTSPPSASGTPCPTSVRVGALAQRNHSDLSSSDKERWRTELGAMSRMDVGPGPDHSGHCMKESLTTITNTCPPAVYTRGGRTIEPCTGNKCLDINRYGTMWGLSDGPTSFFDMHRTRNANSLLEGTGVSSCRVVCEQTYSCDRTQPTTGTFRITRNYHAGTHTTPDGDTIHITTGTVDKTQV